MSRVAVAAASQIAAEAGAAMARAGGNAVDAAIAASVVSMTTDPGIVALGAGSYVTVSVPGGANVVIDGAVEMPGRSAPRELRGAAIRQIHIGYGGGMHTGIGHGSVATPGSIAASNADRVEGRKATWSFGGGSLRDCPREILVTSRVGR